MKRRVTRKANDFKDWMVAACLATTFKRSDREIASALGRTPDAVRKLLTRATENGMILPTEPTERYLLIEEVDTELLQAAYVRDLSVDPSCDLLARIKAEYPKQAKYLHSVSVFGSATGANSIDDAAAWDGACVAFGKRAAKHVRHLLTGADHVGVSRGRQLLAITDQLAATRRTVSAKEMRFFPVWSESFQHQNSEYTSTHFPDPHRTSATYLAEQLSTICIGNAKRVPSMGALPPLIPTEFGERDQDVLWKFYRFDPAYVEVFGDRPWLTGVGKGSDPTGSSLITKMDTAILGAGSVKTPSRFLSTAVLQALKIDQRELEEIALGDVGGLLIPQPKLTTEQSKRFRQLADRWVCLTAKDLSDVAERAIQRLKPGVIVVGVGENRAEVVLRAIAEHSCINHLVIDDYLAVKLDSLVPKLPKGTQGDGKGARRR